MEQTTIKSLLDRLIKASEATIKSGWFSRQAFAKKLKKIKQEYKEIAPYHEIIMAENSERKAEAEECKCNFCRPVSHHVDTKVNTAVDTKVK